MATYMGLVHRVNVPSRTEANTVYTVLMWGPDLDTSICTCPAGKYARPCWHRPAARDEIRANLDLIGERAEETGPAVVVTLEDGQHVTLAGPVRAELFRVENA